MNNKYLSFRPKNSAEHSEKKMTPMNRIFRQPPTPKNYLFGRNAVKRRFVSGAYMLIVCLVILSSAANAPAYAYTSPARQVNSAVSYVWELNASAKSPIFGLDKATAHFEQALSQFDDYEKGIIVAALYLDLSLIHI